MHGPPLDAHIDDAYKVFDLSKVIEEPGAGIVDYVVLGRGQKPPGGIFVLGYLDDPAQAHYFKYYKMGEGPIYTFYTPYHLCHFEVALSCARAVLFHDAVCTPLAGPVVDVITRAKRALKAGEVLDGIGGFLTYGIAENSLKTRTSNFLPMGLSEGCVLKRDVEEDYLITFDDVEFPKGRLCDELWKEQDATFFPGVVPDAAAVAGAGAAAAAAPVALAGAAAAPITA
jgi:predicted homoserine dehydrogenase-like protein